MKVNSNCRLPAVLPRRWPIRDVDLRETPRLEDDNVVGGNVPGGVVWKKQLKMLPCPRLSCSPNTLVRCGCRCCDIRRSSAASATSSIRYLFLHRYQMDDDHRVRSHFKGSWGDTKPPHASVSSGRHLSPQLTSRGDLINAYYINIVRSSRISPQMAD